MPIKVLNISIIDYSLPLFYYAGKPVEKITATTRRRLEELGIEITESMTESDAQAKINDEERRIAKQQELAQNAQSLSGVASKIQDLARKIGITINNDDNVEDIFDYMKTALNKKMLEAVQMQPESIWHYKTLSSELQSLKNEYESMSEIQGTMFDILNIEASSNRISHGL